MFTQSHGEYRAGRYFGMRPELNAKDALFFRYEKVSEREIQFNRTLQKMLTAEASTIIQTSWAHDWKTEAKLQLDNGKMYEIAQIMEKQDEINPQAAMYVESNTIWLLGLKEVNNAANI